jgi:CheY-like chemotaxis protein
LPSDPSRQTVVICDDQKDIVFACTAFLRGRFNVLGATSGEECLKLFSAKKLSGEKIDLLLLDYKLNDMPGDEVARRLKEEQELEGQRATKMILISAYDLDDSTRSRLKSYNIVFELRKPFSMVALQNAVAAALNGG